MDDKELCAFLDRRDIAYQRFDHPAVFTCEAAGKLVPDREAMHKGPEAHALDEAIHPRALRGVYGNGRAPVRHSATQRSLHRRRASRVRAQKIEPLTKALSGERRRIEELERGIDVQRVADGGQDHALVMRHVGSNQ